MLTKKLITRSLIGEEGALQSQIRAVPWLSKSLIRAHLEQLRRCVIAHGIGKKV